MSKKVQKGFTWVSLLTVLVILGILSTEGISSWHTWCTEHKIHVLQHDISHALVFARNEAFLRSETLVLGPSEESNNWALGTVLQSQTNDLVHSWQWQLPKDIVLTWHGFLGSDKLVISHTSEHLAMNGHFLLERAGKASKKWVVNRFGRLRVSIKQVA